MVDKSGDKRSESIVLQVQKYKFAKKDFVNTLLNDVHNKEYRGGVIVLKPGQRLSDKQRE